MASSGSFSGSIHSGHYTLRIDWSQSRNITENTSTVTCKMYLVNDYSLSIGSRSNTCTISGTDYSYSSPSISSTGTHALGSASKTISHNSDGTKSITIKAVFNIQATISGTYYNTITASTTVTLNTIPRASSVSAGSVNLGSATTITISRASSSFTHTLNYAFGSSSGTIVSKTGSTSISWTPPLTLAYQIPKATSGTCKITCITYNGNTYIGSKTCTLTLTVPAAVKPAISGLKAAKVDGDVPGSWDIYVQSKSKTTLTINEATGSYGSTISSYSISGGGYSSTASSFTTGFLKNSGTITFTATVTDSRGRTSAAATVSISVAAYSPPSFRSYLSQRCTSDGTVSEEGTYVKGNITYSYTSCSSKNVITGAICYKKTKDTTWTNASESFSSDTAFTFGNGDISTEYSYDVKYSLTDSFTTISIYDVISTAAVVMDFKVGGKGIAVGKVAEADNTFEISDNWDVMVYGKLLKDYIQQIAATAYPVGSIYMSVNSTNPSTYFGGTWVAWGSGRVPVGINTSDTSFSTAETTGGSASVTLSAGQIPSHTHGVGTLKAANSGAHTHNLQLSKTTWSGSDSNRVVVDSNDYTAITNKATTSAGSHTHTLSGSTASAGTGESHTNLQPYIVCYMWKRTA